MSYPYISIENFISILISLPHRPFSDVVTYLMLIKISATSLGGGLNDNAVHLCTWCIQGKLRVLDQI
jgi:hypothetical protein